MLGVRRRVGITVLPSDSWSQFDPKLIRWKLAGPDRLRHLQSLGELRGAVEPVAARLAADRATPEQCGLLTGAVIGMSTTARAANARVYLEHDVLFHRTLLAASGNEMLAGMDGLVAEVLTGRTQYGLMPAAADPGAIRLHAQVATAVQNGDGAAAEAAMRGILEEASEAVRAMAEPAR
jgi:DNA-binding FadR family transcriptional regulator